MVWNADTNYALGFYKVIGRFIGIWPLEYNRIPSIIRVIIFVATQVWFCIDLTMQVIFKGNCGTLPEVIDVLSWILVGFSTSVKMIFLTIYRCNMKTIMNTAITDWSTVDVPESRQIMLKFATVGRIGSVIQVCSAYSVCVLQITRCLPAITTTLNHQSNSTVPICIPLWPACWVPQNVFDYTINFINQSFLAIILVICYSGCESVFFGTAMHLSGQFEELYRNPKHLDGSGDYSQQLQQLVKFIERHKHLLILAKDFEETYNIIILVHVAVDVLIPCVSGQ
uniref:Olfactory receptor 25 n=1 Tax=Meteorus pulchricornis TaxID=51522 RepID=A0A1S5VFL6_9HYME|nr:olfactory receptor 25 [Meteorus pulchricornis]